MLYNRLLLTFSVSVLTEFLFIADDSILKNGLTSDVSLKRESPLLLDPPDVKRSRDS